VQEYQYADPDCPHCGGTGFIMGESMLEGGYDCECMLDALRRENMEKIWRSLSEAKEVPALREKPPLLRLTSRSLWITSPLELLRRHLKAVCYHKDTMWDAKVRTDAMILDSWFGTLKAQGAKIYDIEIEKSILEAIDIRDLVEPPELCIIVLGIKKLPNKEAPNSLLEAIGYRRHVNKPTWIVDQPDHPIDQMHHKFYSETLDHWLRNKTAWPHIHLTPNGARVDGAPRIQHAVAVADLDDVVDDIVDTDPEPTGNTDIDAALEDVDEMADEELVDLDGSEEEEEEIEEEEGEEEYEEEETDTRNLLGSISAELSDKAKMKAKKKKWGRKS
jgi:hypothetical protein